MSGIPEFFNNKIRRYVWDYHNAQGEIIGHVARFQGGKTKEGKISKEIIPYFNRNGEGWQSGVIEPRPLFGLDVLAKADVSHAVFIVEGEKCAAALHSMGLVAISSQGGSNATSKTDWKPLEGRERVFVLPDKDEAGEHYAKAVCAILASFSNPPTVQIVRLPDLPDAGDVCDWISAQIKAAVMEWDEFAPMPDTGMDMVNLITEFQKVVKENTTPAPDEWLATTATGHTSDWQAPVSLTTARLPLWPDDVFPDSVQNFVSGLAESTETPLELPALLVLASIAAAAQGKYRVRVKHDYFEPVNIWTCAALPPASRKTAVQNAATAPLTAWEKLQREIAEPLIKAAQSECASIAEQVKGLRNQLKKEMAI